jgi:hypothetical protein
MRYLLILAMMTACSSNDEQSTPEPTQINLCKMDFDENMTEYEKSQLLLKSNVINGKHLTFVGIVDDVSTSDLWWKGPTLVLKPLNTDLTTVFGHLPKEWDRFQPSLKKKEKIKISGEGVGNCRENVIGNGYHIFMTIWELERVE